MIQTRVLSACSVLVMNWEKRRLQIVENIVLRQFLGALTYTPVAAFNDEIGASIQLTQEPGSLC